MAVMGNIQKKKHIFYNLNWKKKKSGKKYEKAINRIIFLLKRQDRDGETKWISQTMWRAEARLKKYGITRQQVTTVANRRGLSALLTLWK